jgi:hypothetical protein
MWRQALRSVLTGLFAALLPDPERRRYERRVHVAFWSLLIGLVSLIGGFALTLDDALGFFQEESVRATGLFLERTDPRDFNDPDRKLALYWSGMFVFVLWLAQPKTWLLFYVTLTGGARCLVFGVADQSLGDPAVWACLRIFQLLEGRIDAASRAARRGPQRPDRLFWEDGDLVLLTIREQEGWNEYVTIEVGERFFHLGGVEERQVGSFFSLAYRLWEQGPNEVVRGLVRYEGEAVIEVPPAASRAR